MKNGRLIILATLLVLGVGCGSGGMGNLGGESGGGGNGGGGDSNSASVVVSKTTSGPFSVAMSTSFQPAEWDYQFFTLNPTATTSLTKLGPPHVRLQGVSQGVPQGSEGTTSTAWNFSVLGAITQPVLGVGDHSPEFQIAKAPAFMYLNDGSSDSFTDLTFAQFAGYAQNLLQDYNTGGFTANGQLYESPAFSQGDKVTWWGIYNEPNINNNLTPQQYTDLYNTVVPANQMAISLDGYSVGFLTLKP